MAFYTKSHSWNATKPSRATMMTISGVVNCGGKNTKKKLFYFQHSHWKPASIWKLAHPPLSNSAKKNINSCTFFFAVIYVVLINKVKIRRVSPNTKAIQTILNNTKTTTTQSSHEAAAASISTTIIIHRLHLKRRSVDAYSKYDMADNQYFLFIQHSDTGFKSKSKCD